MDIDFIDIHTHQAYKQASDILFIRQAYLLEFVPVQENYFLSKGIHPWYIKDINHEILFRLAANDKVLTIGECGLDRNKTEFERQKVIFQVQIDLAEQLSKPLIIHIVKAYDELEQMLRGIRVPAIIHQYQGNQIQTERLLKNEKVYFSIGKQIFHQQRKSLLAELPLSKLFFETDTQTYSVEKVYEEYCRLIQIELRSLQTQIKKNFEQVFHLIP